MIINHDNVNANYNANANATTIIILNLIKPNANTRNI